MRTARASPRKERRRSTVWTAITIGALVFCSIFAFLTVFAMIVSGPDLLTGLSFIILALLTFGILGALTEPPDKKR